MEPRLSNLIPVNDIIAELTGSRPLGVKERFLDVSGGRISREEVRRRACDAMQRNLPGFQLCANTSKEWAIIGGGPSINQSLNAIRALKRRGVNIVSVNKSHDWLLDQGIVPWGHVLLDPKEWVADYVKRPRNDVRYFVASQCHADTFDSLDGFPVFLWHAGQDFEEGAEPTCVLKERWPNTPWVVIPGETTVGLRTIHLGHAMGADKFHLFGLDSSRTPNGPMHGYDKPEPPDAETGTIGLKHKGYKFMFDSNAHMVRQQMDFDKFIDELPKHYETGLIRKSFELTVYGSGLLPTFAATIGLHADPECNKDPAKVGGYAEARQIFISTPSVFISGWPKLFEKEDEVVFN